MSGGKTISPHPSSSFLPVSAKRGWCPSIYEPMQSGDGWLIRVKPPGGAITSAEARIIAKAAPGWIELTQRGNLQIRGLREEDVAPFAAAMRSAGLASADPGIERRRNIIPPPLLGHDKTMLPGATEWLAELERILAHDSLAPLPGKFGLALDAGGALPLTGISADLLLRLTPSGAELRLPGLVATNPSSQIIAALLAACGPRRMRDTLVEEPGLLARLGLATRSAPPEPPAPNPIGALADTFGLAPAFGQMRGTDLQALADLAEHHGSGMLRITPWRAILLPGLRIAPDLSGFITDPADPRLILRACPGSAGCARGLADTRADAAHLAAQAYLPGLLHLSGCAKGCAHPGPAPVTLVGQPGGRYALVRNGRAGDAPQRAGLTLAEAAAEMELR
ncbi:precorrin-3B synthase [Pseudoroseomonas globiformis]|uniref:Precorrin-3B synthase n=1 Tax=Teichococcus globiformis TaxID=2307229 RepID=A0ABV7FT87_9PROT